MTLMRPCRPSSRTRSPAAPSWSPPKRSFTPREKYGRLKLADIKPGLPFSNPPPPPRPQRPSVMSSDEFYRSILAHGPDSVWPAHYQALLSSLTCEGEEEEDQERTPRSVPARAREASLFPRRENARGSPGLHRAIIPKLYSLTSWHPRLYHLILPKYLLSMDDEILAHLYRNLGRLQPGPERLQPGLERLQPVVAMDDPPGESDESYEDTDQEEGSYYTSNDLPKGAAERERATFEIMVRAIGRATRLRLPHATSPGILSSLIRGLVECRAYHEDPELLEAWEGKTLSMIKGLPPSHLAEIAVSLGSVSLLPPTSWVKAFYRRAVKVHDSKALGVNQLTQLMIGLAAMKRCDGCSRVKIKGAFGLIQAARNLLSSRWPKSASNVTAPLVFLSSLNHEIEWNGLHATPDETPEAKPWLPWYCFYVDKILEDRPGLMRAGDFCTLVNALANFVSSNDESYTDERAQLGHKVEVLHKDERARAIGPYVESLVDLALLASSHLVSFSSKRANKGGGKEEEEKDSKTRKLIPRAFISISNICSWYMSWYRIRTDKDPKRSRMLQRRLEELALIAATASLSFITDLDVQGLIEASHSAMFLIETSHDQRRGKKSQPYQDQDTTQLVQAWAMAAVLHSQSYLFLASCTLNELLRVTRIVTKLFAVAPLQSPDKARRVPSIPASWFAALLDRATSIDFQPESDPRLKGSSLPDGWTSAWQPNQINGRPMEDALTGAWSAAISLEARDLTLLPLLNQDDSLLLLLTEVLEAPGAFEALSLMARDNTLNHLKGGSGGRKWNEIIVSTTDMCEARSLMDDGFVDLGDKYRLFLVNSIY